MTDISNPAKLLRKVMQITGIGCAKTLAADLGIPLRTIQRLRLEIADATCANDAISGGATHATSAINGVETTTDKKEIPPTPPKEKTTLPRTTVEQASSVAPRDYAALSKALLDACGKAVADPHSCPGIANLMFPEMWMKEGADLETVILPKLREVSKRHIDANKPPIQTWNYYTKAVSEAAAVIKAGLPPVTIGTGNVYQMQSRFPTSNSRIIALAKASEAAMAGEVSA
jgi:hypothetical protein